MIEINRRFLEFSVVVAFCSLVIGFNNEGLELLLKTYDYSRAKTEICQEYFRAQPQNPCQLLRNNIGEIRNTDSNLIHISSEVITGDTEEKNGYRLIVNETLTIDIPAIMKCISKYKNSDKQFVYYMVMYLDGIYNLFEKVVISERKEENKTVFALREAQLTVYILETYQHSNNDERKPIINWFKKNKSPSKAKKVCERLSKLGQLTEKGKPKYWKILDGKTDVEPYTLRVTKTVEVKVRGLVQCNVEYKLTNDAEPIRKTRYFCLAKPDNNFNKSKNHIFSNIDYSGDKRLFVKNKKLL